MNSVDKALKTMIDNLPEKTGRSLEDWFTLLETQRFSKHSEAVKFMKSEHQVTHGYANTIASLFKDRNQEEPDLVESQYTGKEALKPLYEAIIDYAQSLGKDVQIVPKKSTVSIIRKRQFLLIKPATKTRIDLGLKIKGKEIGERLENSGPFGTMCTHRVKLSSIEEIDEELKGWILEAYQTSI